MPNLNEQDRADRDSFEAWAKVALADDLDCDERPFSIGLGGLYENMIVRNAFGPWQAAMQAARRQHGSAAQAVAAEATRKRDWSIAQGVRDWYWRNYPQIAGYHEHPALQDIIAAAPPVAAPPVADAEGVTAQVNADVSEILRLLDIVDKNAGGASGATEGIQEHAEHIRKTVAALSRRPAAAPEGDKLEAEVLGKVLSRTAMQKYRDGEPVLLSPSDLSDIVALTATFGSAPEATPGGNGAAEQAKAAHVGWVNERHGNPPAEQPAAEPELLPLPMLPEILMSTISDYGMARTEGVSESSRIHLWTTLIDCIKAYAGDYARAHLRVAGQGGEIQTESGHVPNRPRPDSDSALLHRLDRWRIAEAKRGFHWSSIHFDMDKPVREQLAAALDKAEAAAKGEQA